MNENENFGTPNLNPIENTDLNMQSPVEGNIVEPNVNVAPVMEDAPVVNEVPVMNEMPTISIEPTNIFEQEASTPNMGFDPMSGGVGVDPVPNNNFMNQNVDANMGNAPVNDNAPKKSNKGIIIGLAVALVVVIALVGGAFLYLNSFTAEKFVEKNVKEINSWIDKAFNNVEYESYDLNTTDVKNSGTITFNTDAKELSDLNGITVSFNSEMSLKNEFESLDLKITKNNTDLISGNLFFDKNTYYFESSDLYSYPIKVNSEINIFETIKEQKIYDTFTVDNIKSLLKSAVNGMGEAIKEANLTTKNSGLKMEYKYEITEENAEKVTNKFEEIMNKNDAYSKFKEFFEENGDFETTTLEPMTITVKVNVLSSEIEEFAIESNNEKLVGTKIGDNKYKIGNDEEYAEIEITDDSITVVAYLDGKKDFELKMVSKNDNNLVVSINEEDFELELDITSKNKKTDATMKIKVADQTYNLKISMSYEYGQNIANKMSFTYAVDAESLTEYDMQLISMKLMNIVGSNFSSLMESFSGVGTGDVESGFDDFDISI